jgi:NAD(P)-dependent dehydrogenase (short-subunit alcohol dehydrogenase family)
VEGLVASLSEGLRVERVKGIHVVTVGPLATDTPFFNHVANGRAGDRTARQRKPDQGYKGCSARMVMLTPAEKVLGTVPKAAEETAAGFKGKMASEVSG